MIFFCSALQFTGCDICKGSIVLASTPICEPQLEEYQLLAHMKDKNTTISLWNSAVHVTCSGYLLPTISATVFRDVALGRVLASIFSTRIILVPLAAILASICASSMVMQAVGIFSTPISPGRTIIVQVAQKPNRFLQLKGHHFPLQLQSNIVLHYCFMIAWPHPIEISTPLWRVTIMTDYISYKAFQCPIPRVGVWDGGLEG